MTSDIQAVIDAERRRHAAAQRRRRHWLRQQMVEASTPSGLLWAQIDAEVEVATLTGLVEGRVVAAHEDAVVVAVPETKVVIAAWAIVSVQGPAVAAAPVAPRGTMVDALVGLAGRSVEVHTADGRLHRGRLGPVGEQLVLVDDGTAITHVTTRWIVQVVEGG